MFFSLFRAAVFSNFSDSNYNINNIKFEEIQDIGFLNDHKKEYLEITGFVETIIVLGYELRDIGFVKDGFVTVEDVNDRFINITKYNTDFIDSNDKFLFYFESIIENKFYFQTQSKDRAWKRREKEILATVDAEKCNSNICYDIIKLVTTIKLGANNKTYITQQHHDTLSNYVELLEKLITGQIVIEIRNGELFANNIKIGFNQSKQSKQSIQNRVTNFCRRTFARSATIHKAAVNTILSVYRHPKINTRYKLDLVDSNLCGGRNNKTQKRHRNKTTYKKMQKTHNIRKRKSNGTKRK